MRAVTPPAFLLRGEKRAAVRVSVEHPLQLELIELLPVVHVILLRVPSDAKVHPPALLVPLLELCRERRARRARRPALGSTADFRSFTSSNAFRYAALARFSFVIASYVSSSTVSGASGSAFSGSFSAAAARIASTFFVSASISALVLFTKSTFSRSAVFAARAPRRRRRRLPRAWD